MAMLNFTVANLALKSIHTDLTSTLATVQWGITGYLIVPTASLPVQPAEIQLRLKTGPVLAVLAGYTDEIAGLTVRRTLSP
tara:strand:+ start:551 stop:793 length:243 start_codon:yes stop_codon:yes gene_type:complete